MKNSIFYIAFICFLMSCSGTKKLDKPEDLISKEKMVNVLIDLSLLSSAKGINKSKIENTGIMPESYVYKKHSIDSLQFVKSNVYYAYNLDAYQDIIKKVTDSLSKLRENYNTLVEEEAEEKRKQDSIKRSKRKNKGFLTEDIEPKRNKD